MESVPPSRQFAYALLATLVAIGVWVEWFQPADGGWILAGAVATFVVLALLDAVVAGRLTTR